MTRLTMLTPILAALLGVGCGGRARPGRASCDLFEDLNYAEADRDLPRPKLKMNG